MTSTINHNVIIGRGAGNPTGREVIRTLNPPGPPRRGQTWEVIQGDAGEVVKELPTVHCVVTSPPYWKKRQYGDSGAEVGREADADEYVSSLAAILAAIPLHPRGSLWVNIGDKRGERGELLGIPHRLSRAMGEAGFLLADDIIWAKAVVGQDGRTEGGFMPDPARARLNGNAFEELFRFVATRKVGDAWTDTCAVSIPRHNVEDVRHLPQELMSCHTSVEGRLLPNVWRIPVGQTTQGHFGVFPPALVERPIAMSCPPWVNPDGSLAERLVEMVEYDEERGSDRYFGKRSRVAPDDDGEMRERCGRNDTGRSAIPRKPTTRGWTPVDPDGAPGVVLDPFCGSGTTGEVAVKLGRSFIGVELYPEYCQMSRDRCERVMDYLAKNDLDPLALMR